MATKKVTVGEVLIETTSYGETLFRGSDKKLYFYYGATLPEAGATITYEYPPTDPEQDQVFAAYATVPNVPGALYREVIYSYEDPDGGINERAGYAAYDPKSKTLSIQEATSWKKKTERYDGEIFTYYDTVLKTNKYTGAALGAIEVKYGLDFNGDTVVGDAITQDFSAGIYLTSFGGLYWSPDPESIGEAPGESAKLLSADQKFIAGLAAAYELLTEAGGQLSTRAVALDKDKEEDDVQIAFPIFKPAKNGELSFASLNLYDINSSTGKYKLTSVAKAADILRYEALFEVDFNNDDVVGDAITGDFGDGVGIYSTVSGSLFWSPDFENIGYAPSSSAKLLSSNQKFLAGWAAAYDALTQAGGQLGVRAIALDKDKAVDDVQVAFPVFKASKTGDYVYTSLNLYDINSGTGKYKVTAITKAADLVKYEDLFGMDFNLA